MQYKIYFKPQAIKDGYKAIHDDASRHDVIAKFDLKYRSVTVLCLTNSDIENIYISLNVKSLSREIRVIARASSDAMHKKFLLAGVDHILTPSNVANVMLRTAIHQPIMYNGMQAILTGKNIANIDEVMVHKHIKLVGKCIHEVDFRRHKILFIGIQRGVDGAFIFNPNREIVFEHDDILLVMGVRISIEYFKKAYAGVPHG